MFSIILECLFIVILRQVRYNRSTMPHEPSITDIQNAYAEFEEGLKAVRKELRELVIRTIQAVDEKQAQKILEKIKAL